MEIDNRICDLSSPETQSMAEDVKIAMAPGVHKVWIVRRGFEPVEERFMAIAGEERTIKPVWRAAPELVERVEPKQEPTAPGPSVAVKEPPSKEPEPKPPSNVKLQALAEWEAKEDRYAEMMASAKKLIAAWDFPRALAALEAMSFEEEDLAARLAAWRGGVKRLDGLKARIIAEINSADPPLKKADLRVRRLGGDLVRADQHAITPVREVAALAPGKRQASCGVPARGRAA